jgi:glycosyltransferase involved in cell wall biosynthesis
LSGTIPEDLKLELLPFKNQIYAPGHINWDDNFINVMQCYMGITPNLEENFSNAILEAQTSGVPFVAFDTGGNKEIIIDEETGFIVPYLDMEALLNKITILLKDTQLQKSFGDNSNSLCAKRFNNKRIKEEYKKVFEQITGK